MKRKFEEVFPQGPWWWKNNKAKGTGNKSSGNKGDSKDKGSGKDWNKGAKGGKDRPKVGRFANVPKGVKVLSATSDHKPICFKFNNGESCDGMCGKVHCCQICFASDHGWPKCPKMLA